MQTSRSASRKGMDEVAAGLPSKSAKIRALFRKGYERADIARYLGVRYQHVYNVLKQSKMEDDDAADSRTPRFLWTKVGAGGKLSIPIAYLEALGLSEGDDVQFALEGKELRVLPKAEVIKRVQELVAKHVPAGVSLVDELIAERRREALAEGGGE